ncbi:MAG: efflux transporter, macrolide exporter (MacB) family, permease protein [Candidatus Angelobacter sp.]|nr:efflux transporter, macrolide exporter (MacB) family, permease protein [Candidatus Angelobacter sp.]
MRWVERFRMAMLMLFRRKAETERLNRELEFHLEQQIAENVSGGMEPEQARLAALRLFGNPTVVRDEARSFWSWNWLESAGRDLRYGVRTLLRTPGFSLTAILVMALGIGATTSLFTIVRSVLLRPLPFREPNKLTMLYEHFRQRSEYPYNVVAPADFRDWRAQTHGFEDMAAWRWWAGHISTVQGEMPEVVTGAGGSWNLFSVLGVQPVFGRTFTPDEDRFGANDVVMLSWGLFQSRFSGDKSIVGKPVRIDSKPYTVVGVLPAWFSYPDPAVKVWIPYTPTFMPEEFRPDHHQSRVIARLKDKQSATAALKEVSALQYQIYMQNQGKPVAEDVISRPIIEDVVEDVKTPLIVLMCSVGCMLLIACLNVSNLLVARSAARRKEVAIRGALGGSRWKLIQEQMTESLLIAIAGGAVGWVLSISATRWLATHWRDLPRADAIQIDASVLAFSIAIVLLTALLAGLVPAISSTGRSLLGALQDSARSIGGSVSRATLRKVLLTAEIALTVILLISAGLLFRSFIHLRTSDLGCVTDNVLTVRFGLPEKKYDTPEKVLAFHEALLGRVRGLPGVKAAGLISTAPGAGYEGDNVFTIPEHPAQGPSLELDALIRKADPGYFSALEIPLISGRVFNEQDKLGRTHHVVISKKFSDQFFPGEDPVGKHVKIAFSGNTPDIYEIIGVVGDTIHDIGQPIKATIYRSILNGDPMLDSVATIVVRAAVEPLSLAMPIQKQISSLDSEMPTYKVRTMQQIVGEATASQSFSASLVLAFALLSLMLAAVGLYGVLSYLVTQRVSEIGIRMALGAQRSEVLRLVLLDGLRPVFIGLVIGIAGGAGAGMLIRSILFGTRPLDPAVFAAMVTSLLFTAVIASAIPALRACRIEPTQALRTE